MTSKSNLTLAMSSEIVLASIRSSASNKTAADSTHYNLFPVQPDQIINVANELPKMEHMWSDSNNSDIDIDDCSGQPSESNRPKEETKLVVESGKEQIRKGSIIVDTGAPIDAGPPWSAQDRDVARAIGEKHEAHKWEQIAKDFIILGVEWRDAKQLKWWWDKYELRRLKKENDYDKWKEPGRKRLMKYFTTGSFPLPSRQI
ncbi:hypothetical protein HK097_000668, partial [Rhizophlyctis rosea]